MLERALCCLLLVAAGCGSEGGAAARTAVAVIPKGTTHEFWKSVHAGALAAGNDLDVDILWKGPAREDDREGQVRVVENFISKRVSGIVLAPLDDTGLARVVREASAASIPVVVIDSALNEPSQISFVATDNYRGGVIAARHLAKLCGGSGKALVMRYQVGSASTEQRERGFLDTMRNDHSGIEIVSDNQYAGATVEDAYSTAENLLIRFKELDGIFCPNESTTVGMLRALQDGGVAGKVRFVGFDSSPKLAEALRKGEVHGLVLQNPFRMGELGVRTLVDHLAGKGVSERIDTGVHLATPHNMDTPEIRKLLFPAKH